MKKLAVIVGLVACGSVANADDDATQAYQPLNPLDPARVVSPISIVQGDGVKVGEGTSFYPEVGVETGYVSNVFYQNANPVDAALLRVMGQVGIGSLSPQRLRPTGLVPATDTDQAPTVDEPGAVNFGASAYLSWDQYLSTDHNLTAQGGLGAGAVLHGLFNAGHPLTVTVQDRFDRFIRAQNYESTTDTNRDVDALMLQIAYAPTGRSLSGMLHYQGTLDLFEDPGAQYGDRFENAVGLRVNYRFLPLTQFYVDVSEGVNTGVGSLSTKVTSYPLLALAGVSTDLTVNTALIARIGYTQGFYVSGPDYASVVGGVYLEHHYSPMGKVQLMYSYDHVDSINANFFRDHTFQAWWEHNFVPFSIFVTPSVMLRQYQGIMAPLIGPPTRDDVIFAVWAGARYQFRNWIQANVEYRLTDDSTDYMFTAGGRPEYIRHEVLAGVRIAY